MTRKQSYETLVHLGEASTELLCDIEYYFTDGLPATMDSPEEFIELEIVGIFFKGANISQYVSDEEAERLGNEIYEAVYGGGSNEHEENIYE